MTKLYVGRGQDAHRMAQADLAARREQAAARQAWLQRWTRIEEARQPLMLYCELLNLLMKAMLVASEWHLHGSEWRRRTMKWPNNYK